MKTAIGHFFLGLSIAFSLSISTISVVIAAGSPGGDAAFPVRFVWQALVLSALCSLINLVYNSDRLTFRLQSILGYLLTTATIMCCCLVFGWLDAAGNDFRKALYALAFFLVCSACYLVTWGIIWRIKRSTEKKLNDTLKVYAERRERAESRENGGLQ